MADEANAGLGLIYPPPDIRGVIDKTAQFVAKCGEEFEKRVLREQNHAKFAFLLPNNPYRAYYDAKVQEFKTGVSESKKPDQPEALRQQKEREEEKQQKKAQMKALTDIKKKKAAKPPPPDQYIVNHPFIAPMDMDIIKLTAQFVARNGQKFLIGLTQRESKNPQFDFLKPTHALFGYFTSLVDCYTKCLMPNKDEVERIKKMADYPLEILDKAMARFAWDEQEDAHRMSREEEEKVEKEQMQQIDWHDFVVVETIEFTRDDESVPLAAPIDPSTMTSGGAPISLDASGPGTVAQQAVIEKPKGVEEEEKQEAEVKPAEEEKKEEEKPAEEEKKEEEKPAEPEKPDEEMPPAEEEEPMEPEPEIPLPSQDPEMKVRRDYVRHKKASSQRMMQRCPITGQLIPAEDMSNHLKVLLLDPKWKQQKDALVERARKESAFADDVEANLAGFVAKRPDLFGSVDEQIREAAEAGAEAAARDAGADAGPAHTMVPPTATTTRQALGNSNAPSLQNAPVSSSSAAVVNPALAPPAGAGPITGVSTINARLPGTSLAVPPQMMPPITPAIHGPGAEDDDDDDEPEAKKPRVEDLLPEAKWVEKYPNPIQVLIQVSLGGDAAAANVPTAIPMELPVRTMVMAMKQLLAPKVAAAGLNIGNMKLKASNQGYILKNVKNLAFYNIGPGTVIELSKKQRGGK